MSLLKKLKLNIKKSLLTTSLSSLLFFNSGCAIVKYGPDLISGHLQILKNSKPIEQVLEDSSVDSEIKEKLHLLQEAKRFGIENLGLKPTKNYERVNLSDSGQYVLLASPKDKLKLKKTNWLFFKSDYLPFFSKKKAIAKKKSLEKKGYDIYLGKIVAYSTLGITKDPIFYESLNEDLFEFLFTFYHEWTHLTARDIKNMDFTEGIASFVGREGAKQFIEHKFGEKSSEYDEIEKIEIDTLFFSCFMEKMYNRLTKLYNQPIPKQEKLEKREIIFSEAKKEFKEKLQPQMKSKKYDYFNDVKLNNAYILMHQLYEEDSNLYRSVYNLSSNQNMQQTLEIFKQASKTKSPDNYLKGYLEKNKQ